MARKKAVDNGKTRCSSRLASHSALAAEEKSKGMPSPGSPVAASPIKKSPRKAAPRGKWSEEQLLTSDKSVLIDADLVKLLASSAAWHCLEEDEKRQILDLLPSDTHPNPDPPADDPDATITPLPESFVRYSNNWRDGIRQFQLDLQNGRYDPEWLRQADEARREREDGAFDSFKDREYELFWGQKQKTDMRAEVGEAGKIKLGTLVEEGVIHIGDVWRFSYVFGKGADRIFIDKETRVQAIHGSKLTFVMPAGQRVFLQSALTDSTKRKPDKPEPQYTQPQKAEDETHDIKKEPVEEASAYPLVQQQDETNPTTISSTDTNANLDSQSTESETPVAINREQTPELIQTVHDEGNTAGWSKIENSHFSPPSSPLSSPPTSPPEPYINTATLAEESKPTVQVVIPSPTKGGSETRKRSTPQPAKESLPKRKRGRPRRNQAKEDTETEPACDVKSESGREPEPKREPEPAPASRPSLQVVLESTPKLEPKLEPTSQTHAHDSEKSHESEKSLENAVASKLVDTSEETTRISQIFDLPASADIPMDVPPATRTDEQHISNHPPPDSRSPPQAIPKVAPQDPTPSSFQSIPELVSDVPEEVIVHDITTPNVLCKKILAVDGRNPGGRTANAWKEIRCYRNNQDIGSLWDVRQGWYFKQK